MSKNLNTVSNYNFDIIAGQTKDHLPVSRQGKFDTSNLKAQMRLSVPRVTGYPRS